MGNVDTQIKVYGLAKDCSRPDDDDEKSHHVNCQRQQFCFIQAAVIAMI